MQTRRTQYLLLAGISCVLFVLTTYYASSTTTQLQPHHLIPAHRKLKNVTLPVVNRTKDVPVFLPVILVESSTVSKPQPSTTKTSTTTSAPSKKVVKYLGNSKKNSIDNGGKLAKLSKAIDDSWKQVKDSGKTSVKNSVKKVENTEISEKTPENDEIFSENSTTLTKESDKGWKTSDLYEGGHSDSNIALCPEGGQSLRLLIIIASAPTHHEARLAIRQTWGHYGRRRDIAIGFLLGETNQQALDDQLAAENFMYGDLIRGHFFDSYNNLTLKTISMLEWVDTYCPQAAFVLKTDDDMFINVPRLLQFIEKHHADHRTIYGRLAKKWKPIRNRKSKYYVSRPQYSPAIFPSFCTGPAYLITGDAVKELYNGALNQTYLKLEDVYTTGIVAEQLNIHRFHAIEFLNRRIAFNQCNIRKAISLHMIKSNEQFDLWKKLLDTKAKCK